MNLDTQAEAAKSIVKALNLKNYVITGSSFGTTVATVAASKIADDSKFKQQQPLSIVLDSTIDSKGDDLKQFVETSRRAWSLLSENERERFRKFVQLFKSKQPEAARRFSDVFYGSNLRAGASVTAYGIRKMINGDPKTVIPMLTRIINGPSNDTKVQNPVYLAAGCETMNHDWKTQSAFLFEDGLIPTGSGEGESTTCKCRTNTTDYDSKNFKVRSPIIYINGTTDPITPYDGARQHFDKQDQAPMKTFISAQDLGHFSVGIYMNALNPSTRLHFLRRRSPLLPYPAWVVGVGHQFLQRRSRPHSDKNAACHFATALSRNRFKQRTQRFDCWIEFSFSFNQIIQSLSTEL